MPPSYPFSSNIRVLCEDGAAEYRFSAQPIQGEGNIGTSEPEVGGIRWYHQADRPRVVSVETASPWDREIDYFLECVGHERHPEHGTGAQALTALRIALAANRSLESGLPEPV